MNKPAPVPTPCDAPQDATVSAEEARIIRERLARFETDRQAARPADDVLERLLRRHPTS